MQATCAPITSTQFQAFYLCRNADGQWPHFLWRCDLKTYKGNISIHHKMGLGHVIKARNKWDVDKPKGPKLEDILHCLLLDSQAREMSFIDWCWNFGYDSDSISAFNTYQECCKSAEKLYALYTRAEIEEIKEALQDY